MKKAIFFVSVFALMPTGSSLAQDASTTTDPFASGPPIVTQMPAVSQWTVNYTYTGDSPKPTAPAGSPPPPLSKRPVRVIVTKTDPIRHEEQYLEQGLRSDLWENGDVIVERKPNNPTLNAYMASIADQNTDFPQFNWISKANFTGIETHDGRKCLVFKESVDIFEIIDPRAFKFGLHAKSYEPAVAYVDLQTRYPVSLQFGKETLQYTFQPAPATPLVMPDEFIAAAKEMKAKIQKALPHPSPP